MAKLYGKELTRKEILGFTGNISQVANISEVELQDGKARGMRAYQVKSPSGLTFDILPDKCLDIGSLSYKGININFQTKNGPVASTYAYPVGGEFDRYFAGGMIMTCGLKNTGGDFTDETGHYQPIHGRLAITPCESSGYKTYWDGDEYVLSAYGRVRDSQMEAHNLLLERRIETSLSSAKITIIDVISNQDLNPEDYLLLYHINFGWPFISADTVLKFPEETKPILARTEHAEEDRENMYTFEPISPDAVETVYFHHPVSDEEGKVSCRIENPALGIGVELCYNNKYLPVLTQWNSLKFGELALGVEPGNSYINGMEQAKKDGMVATLEGLEEHKVTLSLEFYEL